MNNDDMYLILHLQNEAIVSHIYA